VSGQLRGMVLWLSFLLGFGDFWLFEECFLMVCFRLILSLISPPCPFLFIYFWLMLPLISKIFQYL
jgi:hypothetical protein